MHLLSAQLFYERTVQLSLEMFPSRGLLQRQIILIGLPIQQLHCKVTRAWTPTCDVSRLTGKLKKLLAARARLSRSACRLEHVYAKIISNGLTLFESFKGGLSLGFWGPFKGFCCNRVLLRGYVSGVRLGGLTMRIVFWGM